MAVSADSSISVTGPVATLDSYSAQVYAHLHPILVLSIFYQQFGALVADPESTLITLLGPLALLQFIYCIACLPPVGSSTEGNHEKAGPTRKKSGRVVKSVDTSVKHSTKVSVSEGIVLTARC
jgi:GPI ethanolamine phosphate transferase 2/3 subunit F